MPFVAFDDRNDRSRIDNEINRELKQHLFIAHPPKRIARAAEQRLLFVMLAFAVTQGTAPRPSRNARFLTRL